MGAKSTVARFIERRWLEILAAVIPDRCLVCGRSLVVGERHICLHCLSTLPRTDIHHGGFTPLHERLASTDVVIDRVASWFYYSSADPTTAIITAAKYDGRRSLARMNGQLFARELAATGFFDDIDCLQPVPLSTIKRWRRGYNQSRLIAEGIAKETGLPVVNLLKARHHSTQTRKNIFTRWLNTRNVYSATRAACRLAPPPRHILLVDDVLTTGATLIACARALHRALPEATISVITLAATRPR